MNLAAVQELWQKSPAGSCWHTDYSNDRHVRSVDNYVVLRLNTYTAFSQASRDFEAAKGKKTSAQLSKKNGQNNNNLSFFLFVFTEAHILYMFTVNNKIFV